LVILFLAASMAHPQEVDIGSLSSSMLGAKVRVSGEIVKVRIHEDGHVFLRVRDDSGEVAVPIFRNVAQEVDNRCLALGMRISVVGRVQEYRGELEVVPWEGDDVRCQR